MHLSLGNPEKVVRGILEQADIQVNGNRNLEHDILVHDPSFYAQVLRDGRLGLGEAYMDGKWDAVNGRVDTFIEKASRAKLQEQIKWNRHTILAALQARCTNMQTRRRSRHVAELHYDESGILPDPLLDPYNQYTCAYFDETDDLNEAQEKKLDLICRKLELEESDKVLDVGCGWGGFAKYAAEHYGCQVTGISISKEQIRIARDFCAEYPVDIQYCDYRDVQGEYDKALVCGMAEHVGYKNYRRLFQGIHDHLSSAGLFLLHTIGANDSMTTGDPYLTKYIFPNGQAPSLGQIDAAREGIFMLQDFQNLGIHYVPTLGGWHENLVTHWPEIAHLYDERFRRMFEYYLLMCKGGFQAGDMQLFQMVFTKQDNVLDYRGPR